MLGFLRGVSRSVGRETQARRDHHANMLAGRDTHLNRLLQQIQYNKEMAFREDRAERSDFESDRNFNRLTRRDKRQDFVTDRGYQFEVDQAALAESRYDREYALRKKQHADRNKQWLDEYLLRKRASKRDDERFKFNYGEAGVGGYMRQKAGQEQDVHDLMYGPQGYMKQRWQQERDVHDFNYGPDGYMRTQRDMLKDRLDDYRADAPLRELQRAYNQKLGEYNLGDGWTDFLDRQGDAAELRTVDIDLKRAQAAALRAKERGGSSDPLYTPLQSRNIAKELAPTLAKFFKDNSLEGTWNPARWEWFGAPWNNPFRVRIPFDSPDQNRNTMKNLMRQGGAYLMQTLTEQGVDARLAAQLVGPIFEEMINNTDQGKEILKRMTKGAGESQLNPLELRRQLDAFLLEGAGNYIRYGGWQAPENASDTGADDILDRQLPE